MLHLLVFPPLFKAEGDLTPFGVGLRADFEGETALGETGLDDDGGGPEDTDEPLQSLSLSFEAELAAELLLALAVLAESTSSSLIGVCNPFRPTRKAKPFAISPAKSAKPLPISEANDGCFMPICFFKSSAEVIACRNFRLSPLIIPSFEAVRESSRQQVSFEAVRVSRSSTWHVVRSK